MECGKSLDTVPHMRLQLVIRHKTIFFSVEILTKRYEL